MRDLLAAAARQGVTVHVAHLPYPYRGYFDAVNRRAVYDFSLTPIERRCVLAHELGHARYSHDCEDNPSFERQADIYAARLLIDPREYAALERVHPDQHTLADELRVTVDVIKTYETHVLTRVRGLTYDSPRMGLGQWTFRGVHA